MRGERRVQVWGLGAFAYANVFWASDVVRPVPATALGVLAVGAVGYCWRSRTDDPGERLAPAAVLGPVTLGTFLLFVGTAPSAAVGVGLLLAALLMTAPASWRLGTLGTRLAFLGVCLAAQAGLGWVLDRAWSGSPTLSFVGSLASALLRVLGAAAGDNGSGTSVYSMGRLQQVTASVQHLELRALALGALVQVLHVVSWRGSWWPLLRHVAGIALWVPLRFIVLVSLYTLSVDFSPHYGAIGNMTVFLDRTFAFATLVPLMRFSLGVAPKAVSRARPSVAAISGALLAGFAVGNVVGPAVVRPGAPSQLLIDEYHSDWEQIHRPMDKEWYGRASTYNYSVLLDFLSLHYEVGILRERLTPGSLPPGAVLLLKTPTKPYEPAEIDEISRFVAQGGGLLAIGDHTNVFGSSSFLNDIVGRMGVTYRFDAILDTESRFVVVSEPLAGWRHPAALPINRLMFMTGCSLEVSGASEWMQPLVVRHLKSQDLDYAQNNFFPPVEDDPSMPIGSFNMYAAATYGHGRVAAFGDSTVFSNFGICHPGRRELLVGATGWLAGEIDLESLPSWLLWPLVTAWGMAMLAARVRARPEQVVGLLTGSVFLAAIVVFSRCAWNERVFRWPPPREKRVHVEFCGENSTWTVPTADFANSPARNYQIASEWVLRLGYFYEVADDPGGLRLEGDLVVLGGAPPDLDARVVTRLSRYVHAGGRVLLCLAQAGAGGWESLLAEAGLASGDQIEGARDVGPPGGVERWPVRRCYRVRGGDTLLQTNTGVPVMAYAPLGRGSLTVCGLGAEFTDDRMGLNDAREPDPELRQHFELWYKTVSGAVTADWGRVFMK